MFVPLQSFFGRLTLPLGFSMILFSPQFFLDSVKEIFNVADVSCSADSLVGADTTFTCPVCKLEEFFFVFFPHIKKFFCLKQILIISGCEVFGLHLSSFDFILFTLIQFVFVCYVMVCIKLDFLTCWWLK